MTSQPHWTDPQGTTGPQALEQLLRAAPGGADVAERLMAELADVQVAQEELRVAEEEMRSQQEQITQLLLQHDKERRWRGQMTALVPVGLCATMLLSREEAESRLLGSELDEQVRERRARHHRRLLDRAPKTR